MKCKAVLLLGIMVIGLVLVGAPASWANSLTFQDVTFDLSGGGGILTLQISNLNNASGDWTGVNDFDNFEVKDIGAVTFAANALPGWTVVDASLSANGCLNGNTSGGCFTAINPLVAPFADPIILNIAYTGTLDLTAPHLKVLFTTDGVKTGSLLSQTVPSVPEPASLLFLGAGLAGIGIWRRKSGKI